MTTTTPRWPAEHEHGHPNIILAALALASLMSVMDLFIVNVALHTIGSHLHSSLSDVAWVLNAYALFFGALLIPAGRVADKIGRKTVFMLGLFIFTIASLACAVSLDLWVLIAFRCVQAIGAAMLIPSSLGLVLTTMPPARVKRSVRLWAVSGAAAGAIGPVIGGLLTSLSWRWIFLINLPIGIAVFAVSWKMIPFVRHDFSTKMPDLIGSVMVILTIGAISFGLLNGHTWGWGDGRIIASWVVAVVAAVGFVISTRRAAAPVIDPQLFKSRVFTAANVSIVIAATIFGMQLLGMSLFLQQAWHWSTTDTGLAIAPGPVAIVMSSFAAQKLNEKLPVGLVVASGFGIIAAGQILMLLLVKGGGHSYAADILPAWFVIGIGFGLSLPTIIGSATTDLPAKLSATGSAVVNSGRQVGGVFGTAILVVILGKAATTGDPTQYYHLWWVAAAACAVAAVTSLGLTPRRQAEEETGDCRSAPSGSPRAVTETVAGRLPPGGRPLVVTPAKRPGRAPNATEKRWTPVPGSNDHPCIQGAKQQMRNAERWQVGNANPGPVEHAPGGPRLTAKGKAARQRIISAASHAFSERGVTASSNDNILAVAGASHSQLYHYFTDRDDLVVAVIADRVEQVLSHQNSLLADLDSIEGLRLWRDAVVALQEDRECRDGCLIGSLVGELSERDPRSRQAFAAAFERWHEAIRRGLERMRESGEISAAADPDSLALAILAVLEGGLLLAQITRSTSRLEQGLDSIIDLIASYRP
ncbi:MAG TPA: DHA2 family efflux MFS transporter permease subunit [Solirubrobacteraceae bacterium]|jgi:EmrB/QacA subfamily drug resistance transporter|nr:DHA2 family efflux MFS transporter permease subunit [Solirubrobacteraceae bacterium]